MLCITVLRSLFTSQQGVALSRLLAAPRPATARLPSPSLFTSLPALPGTQSPPRPPG